MSNKLKMREDSGENTLSGNVQISSDIQARGDQSEGGVELKSLLKMIDNVIESNPALDDEIAVSQDYRSTVFEKNNPFSFSTPRHRFVPQNSKFNQNFQKSEKKEGKDDKVTLSEVLLVPVKQYPRYNFVGRILGPRGMTVKQLEKETGCKIFVKGRASSASFNPHTKSPRLPFATKNTLSTISQGALTEEPLHVFIECHDTLPMATKKLAHAVAVVKVLLSPPADGKDELKRQQLVDISLINGTYRATSSSQDILRPVRRFGQTVDPTSNPVDSDVDSLNFDGIGGFGGDFTTVYGIAQQKRAWQKPRGPDSTTLEYAKSVSSREYVTDIVNKNKKSPSKNASEDSLFNLPQSVVSETLKVAKNLLASHQHLTFGSNSQAQLSSENDGFSNKSIIGGAGDGAAMKTVWKKDPSSPPPLMSSLCSPPPVPFPSDFYYPSSHFPDYQVPQNGLYFMVPPPTSPNPFSTRRY